MARVQLLIQDYEAYQLIAKSIVKQGYNPSMYSDTNGHQPIVSSRLYCGWGIGLVGRLAAGR